MNTSVSPIPMPIGFSAAGMHCGIKKDPALSDLAVFASSLPCSSAGVFTSNLVNGAPVKVSRQRVLRNSTRAVVMNSGNSNACTGQKGIEDAEWMTGLCARELGCANEDVLVCSTGVIGRFLPRAPIQAGIPSVVARLSATPDGLMAAARAIMTTDTFPKLSTRNAEIGTRSVRVTGVAKGAAMIAPNMATMLSVIMTDAAVTPADADRLLRHAVGQSFNCISVDGHQSTSDTVLLLCNGGWGGGQMSAADQGRLQEMIDDVAGDLARAIIRDAEGADHAITIDVRGLPTREAAFRIAKSIADSALVKTAITGGDPNWGRIVSAAGYAGVPLQEKDISLRLNGFLLYEAGAPLPFQPAEVSASIKGNRDVSIELDLTLGNESCRFWTSDLTAEYVRLNADYTT